MYKINYKNLKKGYGFYGTFFGIGMIFLLILVWFSFQGSIRKITMDSEVKAYDVQVATMKDSDGHTTYQPTYYYIVNGQEYTYTLSYSINAAVSKMKTKNIIYYESSNPYNCVSEYETTINAINVFSIAFILIFPVFGLKGMLEVKKSINKVKWLAENGTLIKGLKYELVDTR